MILNDSHIKCDPCDEISAAAAPRAAVELSSREVFLLIRENVRQLEEKKPSFTPVCHKRVTAKMRELLDLFDESEHREAVKHAEWLEKIRIKNIF